LEIDLETKTTILELQTWMDGGSITLICINEKQQEFKVHFVQNVIWEIIKEHKLPGRIYFKEKLINQRSEIENSLIKNIENANFKGLSILEKGISKEKVQYDKSEKYLKDIGRIKFFERKNKKLIKIDF